MSNLLFKEKYLKSKKDYLNLVMTNQNGGVTYDSGKYMFFIPSTDASKIIKLIDNRNYIKYSFLGTMNYFTDQISEDSKFLRLGSTITGNDINNTYNTIYPNQGIFTSTSRKAINTSSNLRAIDIREIGNASSTDIGNIGSTKKKIEDYIKDYLLKIYNFVEDKTKYQSGKVLIINTSLASTIVTTHYNYTIDNNIVTLTNAMKQ